MGLSYLNYDNPCLSWCVFKSIIHIELVVRLI